MWKEKGAMVFFKKTVNNARELLCWSHSFKGFLCCYLSSGSNREEAGQTEVIDKALYRSGQH